MVVLGRFLRWHGANVQRRNVRSFTLGRPTLLTTEIQQHHWRFVISQKPLLPTTKVQRCDAR